MTTTPAPATSTVLSTPSGFVCVGDCDGNHRVSVEEIVIGVNIALGLLESGACSAMNCNDDGPVTVDCLVKAVNNALEGCSA